MSGILRTGRLSSTCTKNLSVSIPQQIRNAHTHRTITVQLTADVPGLGEFGSLQHVRPGRMRNLLRPKGLAEYVVRGVGPALLTRPELAIDYTTLSEYEEGSRPHTPAINLEALRQKLAALPPLIFRRRVRPQVADFSTQRIYGSVTANDVVKLISDEHGMSIVPPDAIVTLMGHGHSPMTKYKALGTWDVIVTLKTGETVPLVVQVEEKTAE